MPDDLATRPFRTVPTPAAAADLAPTDSSPPRRCSRCRSVFPGREERTATGHVVWWLCDPCHEALLGAGAR